MPWSGFINPIVLKQIPILSSIVWTVEGGTSVSQTGRFATFVLNAAGAGKVVKAKVNYGFVEKSKSFDVVEVTEIEAKDGSRKSKDGLLEVVVPPIFGSSVDLTATLQPNSVTITDFPEWTITNVTPNPTGITTSFTANSDSTPLDWLYSISPNIYNVNAGGRNLVVKAYPDKTGKVTVDFDKMKVVVDAWNNSLGRITGFNVDGPYGKFEFKNQWKETNSNESMLSVHFKYEEPSLKDFISVDFKDKRIYPPIPNAPTSSLPTWLTPYLPDLGIYISITGKINLSIDLYKDVDTNLNIIYGTKGVGTGSIKGDLYGKLQVPGIYLQAGAVTGFKAELGTTMTNKKIKVGITPQWDGIKGYVRLGDAWKWFSVEEEWTFFDKVTFLEGNIVDKDI
jgi:hypothetical protein